MLKKRNQGLSYLLILATFFAVFGFMSFHSRIYAATGDLYQEDFEAGVIGQIPSGWVAGSASTISFAVSELPGYSGKLLKLNQFALSSSTYNFKKNISQTGIRKAVMTYKIRAEQTNAAIYIPRTLTGAGLELSKIIMNSNGYIAVWNKEESKWVSVVPYAAGQWYDVKLVVNIDTKKYDVYLDGVPIVTQREMEGTTTEASVVTGIGMGIYKETIGTIYVDDITLSTYTAATSASFAEEEYDVARGSTRQLQLDFLPADAATQIAVWTSSDPAVAEVDDHGVVTGKSVGAAIISADPIEEGLPVVTVVCNVYEQGVESVTLEPAAAIVPAGSTRLLEATVLPADSSDKTVVWTSSNPAVAQVDAYGEVTGLLEGTAEITATSLANPAAQATGTVQVVNRTVMQALYVAPNGNDSNPGTEQSPFRTLQKAKAAVQELNGNMTGDIVVYLRNGVYVQDSTISFDEHDSGTNGYFVTYTAYPGEKAEISGGKTFTGWTLHDEQKNIYKLNVGAGLETRQLFINGVRAVRARSQTGLINGVVTSTGYTSDDVSLASWSKPSDLEFVYIKDWTNPRCGVASVAVSNGKAVITMDQPGWRAVTNKGGTSVTLPIYYENAYELLDDNGEWYLDSASGELFYRPRAWEDMNTAVATLPVLEQMLTIKGSSADHIVRNIEFKNLSFNYTTWLFPSTGYGLSDAQNNHLRYWNLGLQDYLPDAAITLELSNSIHFENSDFSKLGITAIKMVNGVQNTLIRGNRFYDISGSAINIGEPDRSNVDAYNPSDKRLVVKNNDVISNYIHDIGVDYKSAAAISAAYPENVDIIGNEIGNIPYSGLHIGYGFKMIFPNTLRNMKVQNNFIHDLLGEGLKDGGAIYLNGNSGGTADNMNLVSGNYVKNQMHINAPLYPDEGTSFWKFESNVIDATETTSWAGIPARWAMVWVDSIHDVTFDNNYTTTSNLVNNGVNNVIFSNTHVHPDANWPQEAQNIIDQSGLPADYKYLAAGYVERLHTSELMMDIGESKQAVVDAKTAKGDIIDTSDMGVYYTIEDPTVAAVDASGNVTGLKSGRTKLTVHVETSTILKTASADVFVADSISGIAIEGIPGSNIHLMNGQSKTVEAYGVTAQGNQLELDDVTFASSNSNIAAVDSYGNIAALAPGACTLTIEGNSNGQSVSTQFTIIVSQYGVAEPYALGDELSDLDNWYLDGAGASKTFADGSLTISTPNGYAVYQGELYQNELLQFNMTINGANTGWPSLLIRNQKPDKGINDTTYIICFKPDVLELHRFNQGARTVIYGNIAGYTSVGGDAIPNTMVPFNQQHLLQWGAVNEENGVRLILNVNGTNVINFLDTDVNALKDPGYIGVYAKTGSMTLAEVSQPEN